MYEKTCDLVDFYEAINTRTLADEVVCKLKEDIPGISVNVHHVYGYIKCMLYPNNGDAASYVLDPRVEGASVIAVVKNSGSNRRLFD